MIRYVRACLVERRWWMQAACLLSGAKPAAMFVFHRLLLRLPAWSGPVAGHTDARKLLARFPFEGRIEGGKGRVSGVALCNRDM